MLEAEIDVFSGMPNPTFELSEREERYRGVIIRQIKTDAGPWSTSKRPNDVSIVCELAASPGAFPTEFRLGTRQARGESIEGWLLNIAERKRLAISHEVLEAIDADLKK